MIREMAARADRAMRTNAARRTAAVAAELVQDAVRDAVSFADAEARALARLEVQRGWSRTAEREFAFAFGTRRGTLTSPRPFDPEVLARLITRVEVNVCVGGGVDDVLLRSLQSLAESEVRRRFDPPD